MIAASGYFRGEASSPMVSVVVMDGGSGDNIANALDSILSQKTSFPVEILLCGDIPSRNADILEDYQSRYPGAISVPCGDDDGSVYDALRRARGRFTAYIGSGDVWCDRHKLQMQVDLLLSNQMYIGSCHKSRTADDFGSEEQENSSFNEEVYTCSHFDGVLLPGHLSSLVHRNIMESPLRDNSLLGRVGEKYFDTALFMLLCAQGDIYCHQLVMSICAGSVQEEKLSDEELVAEYRSIRAMEKYAAAYHPKKIDFSSRCDRLFADAAMRFLACPSPDTAEAAKGMLSDAERPFVYIRHFVRSLPGRIWAKLSGILRTKGSVADE